MRAPLALGLALLAGVATAEPMPAPYLAAGALDAAAILPPPPTPGSAAQGADAAAYAATRALAGSPRWGLAVSDVPSGVARLLDGFACAAGRRLDPARLPALAALLARTRRDVVAVVRDAKTRFARPRPHLGNDAALCVPRSEALDRSFSYPSGHATEGWTFALVLAALMPERSTRSCAAAGATARAGSSAGCTGRATSRPDGSPAAPCSRSSSAMRRSGPTSSGPGANSPPCLQMRGRLPARATSRDHAWPGRRWLIAGIPAASNHECAEISIDEQGALRWCSKPTVQPFWANDHCGRDSRCQCRIPGSKARESGAIFFLRNRHARVLAIHIEFKHPREKFGFGQPEAYPLRAECWSRTHADRKTVNPHQDWATVLFSRS